MDACLFFFFLWCLRSWKSLGFVVSLDFASGGSKSCKEVGFCFLIVEINILRGSMFCTKCSEYNCNCSCKD